MIAYNDVIDRGIYDRRPKIDRMFELQDCKAFPFGASFGCVYFVKSDAYIKIGSTRKLQLRLVDLKVSNAYLDLLGILIRENYLTLERRIQNQFIQHHVRGEWFQSNQEIEDYIQLNMNDYDKLGYPLYREILHNNKTVVSENRKRFLERRQKYKDSEWMR